MERLVAGRDNRVIMRSLRAGRVWSGSRSREGKRRKSPVCAAAPRSRLRPCVRGIGRPGNAHRSRSSSLFSIACAAIWSLLGDGPSFMPRLADRPQAIYAVAANGRALPAAAGTCVLDKALETPDVIAARAAKALDFRPDINGLRALAVLGVVVFHADRAWLPGGFVGVDIFFVISGFLISRIILSQCAAGRFSLAMFYARRAKRILPALLVIGEFRLDRWVVHGCADPIS